MPPKQMDTQRISWISTGIKKFHRSWRKKKKVRRILARSSKTTSDLQRPKRELLSVPCVYWTQCLFVKGFISSLSAKISKTFWTLVSAKRWEDKSQLDDSLTTRKPTAFRRRRDRGHQVSFRKTKQPVWVTSRIRWICYLVVWY